MTKRNFFVLTVLFGWLLVAITLTACGDAATSTSAPAVSSTPSVPTATPAPPTATPLPPTVTPAPPTKGAISAPPLVSSPIMSPTAGSGDTASVPKEAMTAVVNDLKNRGNANVVESDVKVTTFDAVEFPDGSLGCPAPGTMYSQVLTPGFKMGVTYNGKSYDYRINARGFRAVLCDAASGQPVGKP